MTVDLSFTKKNDWEHVYEPSEDTFFMEDTFELDKKCIIESNPNLICEVGCGSGYLTSCLLSILKSENKKMPLPYMIDVNIKALELSERLLKRNHPEVPVEFIRMNLFSSLKKNKPNEYLFKIIIFNPPYVPSANHDLINANISMGIDCSWSGGTNGLFYISYFIFGDLRLISKSDKIVSNNTIFKCHVPIPCIVDVLLPKGICYLLLEERNKPRYVLESIHKDQRYLDWDVNIISEKKIRFEHLYILKFSRS
ncbi:Ydr140wp-like family archaeal- RNA methylase [Cryptosporidium bovis]|uniref:Ydr140wp-like family archaeal- RNA methylase n=1 Tax=Cryptosporidium bovis TaxID=310047 RepID=UPI003519EB5D|nr:Ydr140wp-like family archaeal- RNA methylase [Cryptosporidium bovis]